MVDRIFAEWQYLLTLNNYVVDDKLTFKGKFIYPGGNGTTGAYDTCDGPYWGGAPMKPFDKACFLMLTGNTSNLGISVYSLGNLVLGT